MGRGLGLARIAKWLLLAFLLVPGWAQETLKPVGPAAVRHGGPAEKLYLALQQVGLDPSRVFHARDISIDRTSVHFTLEDGTIAFTEDVAGRVTGAFFQGEGEVLLMPSDEVERASMSLFTGGAILEEQFSTAYFRFNDDTYDDLRASLQAAEDPQAFVAQWNETARRMAEVDAFRLLLTFGQSLPARGSEPQNLEMGVRADDRMLHASLQGRNLGAFDVYFDAAAAEQVRAGAFTTAQGEGFYDVWASFSPRPQTRPSQETGSATDEEAGTDSVHVSSYKIRVDIKLPTELKADATVQLEVLQGGPRMLVFELSRFLQMQQAEADGEPVEFIQNPALEGTQLARRGNDLVALMFPHPMRTGQQMRLRFRYGGHVLSEAGGGLLYVGERGLWYPNRGRVMCNFDLEFAYPAGWTLLATGKRSPAPLNAKAQGGEQVGRWVSDRPIPFAGFNLGKYERAAARAGAVTVETYAAAGVERSFPQPKGETVVPPPIMNPRGLQPSPMVARPNSLSPARNEQTVADASARALEFFARRFGSFPYSNLAVTQIPGTASQGWPGLIYLSSFAFLNSQQQTELQMSPVQKTHADKLIAHETAHQWWGDLIGWKGYRDQWLFEGLAEYSSLMLLESENPTAFRELMDQYREDLLAKNKDGAPLMDAGPVTLGVRLSSSHFPLGYEGVSYERGAWLFHTLRTMMRDADRKASRPSATRESTDEPFVRALRKLRDRYEQKSISTRDLLRAFEEELPPSLWYEGHRSLSWFYQGWINGTAIPRLEVHAVKYVDGPGSTVISGILLQKDAPTELVTSVPLYGTAGGRSVLLGRVFADGAETGFRMIAPAGTRRVVVDLNRTLLARLH